MKNRKTRLFVCLLLVIAVMGLQTGCQKKERQSKKSVKLSESVRTIPVSELLPKSKNVTGKFKNGVSEKVLDEYMYGTLAGQYGKIDTAEKHLLKTIKMEPLFVDAHHNLGLAYYKKGRIDEAIRCWRRALELAAPDDLV